jgi:hypothetical protein
MRSRASILPRQRGLSPPPSRETTYSLNGAVFLASGCQARRTRSTTLLCHGSCAAPRGQTTGSSRLCPLREAGPHQSFTQARSSQDPGGHTSSSQFAMYAAVGLPLRPYSNGTYLSPLASSLAVANISGVQWYDAVRGDWTAHASWMPPGTYDVPLEMVMAVQVCALNPTRIVFTGV